MNWPVAYINRFVVNSKWLVGLKLKTSSAIEEVFLLKKFTAARHSRHSNHFRHCFSNVGRTLHH